MNHSLSKTARLLAGAGCALALASQAQAVILIDNFNSPTVTLQATNLVPYRSTTVSTAPGDSIAATRLITAELPIGIGPDVYNGISGNPANGYAANFRIDPVLGGSANGRGTFIWSGGALATGVDLTEGGLINNRFVLNLNYSALVDVRIRVNNVWSTLQVLPYSTTATVFEIGFDQFALADFTSVTDLAIEFTSLRASSLLILDSLEVVGDPAPVSTGGGTTGTGGGTVAGVPEPGAWTLFGLGLLGLFGTRQGKRRG